MPAAVRRRSRLGLFVPALIAFAILVGLGTWQLERKAWKDGLIAALNERVAAAPAALPAPAAWPRLEAASEDYRRVTLNATFDHGNEALVYAAPSAFRPDVSGPGYWVFTPARLAGGALVMVNRGFVPEARRDPASRAAGKLAGPIEITGALRWPDERRFFSPADEPRNNLWFVRDPQAIAAAKGIGAVAPFYIEQESPVPPGGLPQPGRLAVTLRNAHLQYAITWYGLALVLVVMFALWTRASWRDAGNGRRSRVDRHGPEDS